MLTRPYPVAMVHAIWSGVIPARSSTSRYARSAEAPAFAPVLMTTLATILRASFMTTAFVEVEPESSPTTKVAALLMGEPFWLARCSFCEAPIDSRNASSRVSICPWLCAVQSVSSASIGAGDVRLRSLYS